MTPKSLLREPKACCSREDLEYGRFQTVMDDPRATDRAGSIRRLIFCTGKIYVDLIKTPDFENSTDVAAIRIEELYPFPLAEIRDVIARYPNAEDYVWLQEEPKNMGAWFYIYPRLNEVLLRGLQLRYVGRAASASTAAGTESAHFAEQARILSQAVSWETESSLTRSKDTNVH